MDKTDQIRELYDLKTSGVLSDDEFDIEKNKILNEDVSPPAMAPSRPSRVMRGGMPLPPPPQRGHGDKVAIIAIVTIILIVITIILAAVMYVWAASFLEQGESAPIATFIVEKTSGGYWNVEVIKVSKQEDLSSFSFFLKDPGGSTYVGGNGFGEIAMQEIGGELHGIDEYYDGYDNRLKQRSDNVSNDDGSNFPVHFSDNDRNGKLSAGDRFEIYGEGNSANGPAETNWKLDIQFDPSGDIIGSATL